MNVPLKADRKPEVQFDGGTEAEREELLELFMRFWRANDIFDSPVLEETWDHDPSRAFFNSNGHTYYGLNDWLKIWDYYRPRFDNKVPGAVADTRMIIRGDMALITDDRVSRTYDWVGEGDAPGLVANPVVRATMVYLRTGDGWRCAHAHFSSHEPGQRPDESE